MVRSLGGWPKTRDESATPLLGGGGTSARGRGDVFGVSFLLSWMSFNLSPPEVAFVRVEALDGTKTVPCLCYFHEAKQVFAIVERNSRILPYVELLCS